MEQLYYTFLKTPIGGLLIASTEKGLITIHMNVEDHPIQVQALRHQFPKAELIENLGKNQEAVRQLKEYFDGKRKDFDCKLDLRGSDFRNKALKAVSKIPYGKTASYGEIAHNIKHPKAARAVGSANRTNPIPIIIPCHRIIGSDGSLVGYGGRLDLKQWLLDFERKS